MRSRSCTARSGLPLGATNHARHSCISRLRARLQRAERASLSPLVLRRFHRAVFSGLLPPIGQDLQLTIVSTDDNVPADKLAAGAEQMAAITRSIRSATVCRAARLLGTAAEGRGPSRHGIYHPLAFKRDGEVIAPPRWPMQAKTRGRCAQCLSHAVEAPLKRLHAAAFQRGMAARCRPTDRHPLRRRSDDR